VEKSSNKRYILILLLFFHTVNTYMDRICISAASSEIQSDLHISSQMMGYIFGVFALGYALFQIPSGWLADKYGPKKALTWVVISWSSFTALTGTAWNAASLMDTFKGTGTCKWYFSFRCQSWSCSLFIPSPFPHKKGRMENDFYNNRFIGTGMGRCLELVVQGQSPAEQKDKPERAGVY
jgi:MFS family permease